MEELNILIRPKGPDPIHGGFLPESYNDPAILALPQISPESGSIIHTKRDRDQAVAVFARMGTFLPAPTLHILISNTPSLTVAFTRSGSI
jgi:hypothetical protein